MLTGLRDLVRYTGVNAIVGDGALGRQGRRTAGSSSSDFLHYLSVSEQGSAAQDISNENGNEKVQQQLPVAAEDRRLQGTCRE